MGIFQKIEYFSKTLERQRYQYVYLTKSGLMKLLFIFQVLRHEKCLYCDE